MHAINCQRCSNMLGIQNKRSSIRRGGKNLLERLVELSWNGRFFTHFIDDDPSVKRDLGVDEKSQIAQGTCIHQPRTPSLDECSYY